MNMPQLGLGTFRLQGQAAIDALDNGGRLVSPDFAPAWD